MEKIIVATWGIGPSYRRRIKLNIQKAIDTQYDNILPYIILTDEPSEFYELQDKTKKIIDIVDFHTTREKYSPWSENYEYVSRETTEEKYGEDFVNNRHIGKNFSYGLHRFYLPRISELGYNRFLHNDADYDIRYDKIVNGKIKENDFWNEFDTPVNTMKGTDLTVYNPDRMWGQVMINISNILRYEMKKRHPEYKNKIHYIYDNFTFTEGPFRYYHIESPDNVLKYFQFWDEVTEINLTDNELKSQIGGSTAGIYLDYHFWNVVNQMLGITPMNFGREYHDMHIYWSDRYFSPPPLSIISPKTGKEIIVMPAKTKKEFLENNKEALDLLLATGMFTGKDFGDQSPD